jgi:hypothetical protein
MPSQYTGKWRIGRRVWFQHNVGAISAGVNGGVIQDDGVITGTEVANGGFRMYVIDSRALVFEHEIKGYGAHPELVPLGHRWQWEPIKSF